MSKWAWVAGLSVLFVIAGLLYAAALQFDSKPASNPIGTVANEILNIAGTSKIAQSATLQTSASIVISSPKSGEKHCLGDIIPIRWSAPKTAQSFILKVGWPSGSAQITSVAGNTAQFTSPVYYDYGWNQKSSAGISYTAGGGYYVSVTAHFKDGSSATARSVGVFVLAACPKTTS